MYWMDCLSGAVRSNTHFEAPSRKLFQDSITNALRAAKQKQRRTSDSRKEEGTSKRRRIEDIADGLYGAAADINTTNPADDVDEQDSEDEDPEDNYVNL